MVSLLKRLGPWIFTAAAWAGLTVCIYVLLGECIVLMAQGRGLLELLLAALGGFFLFWVIVAAHEFGHALAACCVRFRIMRIIIGPFRLVREGQALRLRCNRPHYRLSFVLAVPTSGDALPRRMAIFLAGGPLANLLAGIITLSAAASLGGLWRLAVPEHWTLRPSGGVPGASWWLRVSTLLNGILFFGNLVPMRTRGFLSDGAQLMYWLGGGRLSEPDYVVVMLTSLLLGGVRPRDWNADLVERLLASRQETAGDLPANQLGYYYFVDTGNLQRARELLDLALAQSKPLAAGFRAGLLLEATYFYAFQVRDLAAAQGFWQQVMGGDIEKQTWLRAEAALAFAQGDYAEAVVHAEAGLALIPHSNDPGGALAEKDWLQAIVEQSRHALTAAGGKTPATDRVEFEVTE